LDSVVGTAASYGQDGLGFEPQQGQDIRFSPEPPRSALEPKDPPTELVSEFFRRVKAAGA
jgi:hypothetical protein